MPNLDYSRYLPYYYCPLSMLSHTHPDAEKLFMQSGFIVACSNVEVEKVENVQK